MIDPETTDCSRTTPKKEESSTPESQAPIKRMTLNDRSNFSRHSIQDTKSSPISVPESISKERDSPWWWNNVCAVKSRKLLLPTEIDSQGSESSSSKPSSETLQQSSQSSTTLPKPNPPNNSQTISCPSFKSLLANATASGATVDLPKMKAKSAIEHRKRLKSKEVRQFAEDLIEEFSLDHKETKDERKQRREMSRSVVNSDQEFLSWLKTQKPEEESEKHCRSCRKIRMFPTKPQRKVLDRWLLACKKTWNMATDLVNKNKAKPDFHDLDQRIVTKAGLASIRESQGSAFTNPRTRTADTVLAAPSDVRKFVTKQFASNFSSAKTNAKGRRFRMHPIPYAKKDGTFQAEHQYMKLDLQNGTVRFHDPTEVVGKTERGTTMYPGTIRLHKQKRRDSRMLPFDDSPHDVTVLKKKGRFFLCVPLFERADPAISNHSIEEDGVLDENETIALDPGVRTFMTGFCAGTGRIIEYGNAKDLKPRLALSNKREVGITNKMDQMIREGYSHVEYRKERKKKLFFKLRKLRSRRHKHAQRQENIVREFHLDCATKMLSQFKHIILPKFSTKNIHKLKVSQETKDYAKKLNHFKFRQRLLFKTWKHPGTVVWLCSEENTTMCCGRCGLNNRQVGDAEIFQCPECHFQAPRDHNASKNIHLKTVYGNSHST